MAINKNFVIKNGLEVNTNVLVAASDESQVGVGTTRPYYKLHVGGGEGNRGGIGATDITITGIATVGVANSSSGALNVLGISTFKGDIDLIGSAGISTVRWDASKDALVFQDNAYARFGTGEDLKIWHDGSNSYIQEAGTGGLIIYGTDETLAVFTDDGSVQLYNNNSKKLETTGLGITVYGDAIVSGVTTTARLKVTGISTFATNTVINSTSIKVGSAVSIHTDGNAAFAGIVTANDKIRAGVGFTVDANTGNVAISGITTIGGNLYVTGDIVYDEVTGRNLNITGFSTFANDVLFDNSANANKDILWDQSANKLNFSDDVKAIFGNGDDLDIYSNGSTSFIEDSQGDFRIRGDAVKIQSAGGENAAQFIANSHAMLYFDNAEKFRTSPGGAVVSGVMTATEFVGVFTSAGGAGIGIGSTTAHVGYGVTYIDFKGPGVSTVYSSSVTGITTIYFQGGGGSGVGAAGTWQNDGPSGISTAKNIGINTVGVAVTALQGGQKGGSSGIGASAYGAYIGNGMIINDNILNGDHYIGTAFNGLMAGPVTVNGYVTVDGNWAVV